MKYIVANWKSNKNLEQALSWLEVFSADGFSVHFGADRRAIIAAPMPLIGVIGEKFKNNPDYQYTDLAVQDISQFGAGSYTGAVSAVNLEGLGVSYAIVGHSERRRYFKETNQDVANKVETCLEAGIRPIVCIDEDYLVSQASMLTKAQLSKCIIAYEPLAAIGTGDEMKPTKVLQVADQIKKYYGQVPVIYGGSVDPDNVANYLEICDGVLVGGSSLKAEKFKQLF